MSTASDTVAGASGPTRRKLLTTAAWATPAVLLAVATPAASASASEVMSSLSFRSLNVDFESDQYPFYTIGIQLQLDHITWGGDYRAVTSATVEIEFLPSDAPFIFDVKNYGDGWNTPVIVDNRISVIWAGPAIHAGTTENHTPPIQFKVKGTATHLTAFNVTAASPDAQAIVVQNQAVTGF